MVPATPADDCCALIVEHEPVQAFALECLLGELGCRTIGPLTAVKEVEKVLTEERPSFALLEGNMPEQTLLPLADCLTGHDVPFVLLAVGSGRGTWDQLDSLRERPRLTRPFHPPSLKQAVNSLYRDDLANKLAWMDRHLAEGRRRLAQQLRLVERLNAAGQDATLADSMGREYGRLLQTMRATREILANRHDLLLE